MNIWSENKYLNICINILIFLAGINFLHYGQLVLPVICLLLFIDNKLRFKVNNPLVFIILCLFGVSFYAFSYQLGFYSVMGFTLPMAYYIGSNMRECNLENIKKVIYLFALSMASHIFLNIIYELQFRGLERLLNSSAHYDFWTRDKMSTTVTATNLMFLIGSLYYLLFHEKNRRLVFVMTLVFIITMGYCLIIGRRTSVLSLIIVFILSFIIEAIHSRENKKVNKRLIYFVIAIVVVSLIFIVLFFINCNGVNTIFDNVYIIYKFRQSIFDENRFLLYKSFIKYMPTYLWGGQKISQAIGMQIHELWLDVYDYAGIVPYLLLLVYTFFFVKEIIKLYKNNIPIEYKILFLDIFLVIAIQMFLEPVMTGASLFLLISIIYGAIIEKMNNK